jgi:hypothetical protein
MKKKNNYVKAQTTVGGGGKVRGGNPLPPAIILGHLPPL